MFVVLPADGGRAGRTVLVGPELVRAGEVVRPVVPAYAITRAVSFTSDAGDGAGQRADSVAAVDGESIVVFSMYGRVDAMNAAFWGGQWSADPGQNSWIIATVTLDFYGAGTGGPGWRFWLQGVGLPLAMEWVVPDIADTDVFHLVWLFNGTEIEAGTARVRLWASRNGGAFEERTLARRENFGPSAVPATLPASTEPITIGGDTYPTAFAAHGTIADFGIWIPGAPPSDASILELNADGAPVDFAGPLTLGAPANWWRMGNGPGDPAQGDSGVIIDFGARGQNLTLTNGGAPASDPVVVSFP